MPFIATMNGDLVRILLRAYCVDKVVPLTEFVECAD